MMGGESNRLAEWERVEGPVTPKASPNERVGTITSFEPEGMDTPLQHQSPANAAAAPTTDNALASKSTAEAGMYLINAGSLTFSSLLSCIE